MSGEEELRWRSHDVKAREMTECTCRAEGSHDCGCPRARDFRIETLNCRIGLQFHGDEDKWDFRWSKPGGKEREMKSNEFMDNAVRRQEIEQRARADYRRMLGKIIVCKYVEGWDDDREEWAPLAFRPPVRARVAPTPPHEILRWQGDWLDPMWLVEPVEEADRRRMRESGMTEWWVYADGRCVDGTVQKAEEWKEERERRSWASRLWSRVRAFFHKPG